MTSRLVVDTTETFESLRQLGASSVELDRLSENLTGDLPDLGLSFSHHRCPDDGECPECVTAPGTDDIVVVLGRVGGETNVAATTLGARENDAVCHE